MMSTQLSNPAQTLIAELEQMLACVRPPLVKGFTYKDTEAQFEAAKLAAARFRVTNELAEPENTPEFNAALATWAIARKIIPAPD